MLDKRGKASFNDARGWLKARCYRRNATSSSKRRLFVSTVATNAFVSRCFVKPRICLKGVIVHRIPTSRVSLSCSLLVNRTRGSERGDDAKRKLNYRLLNKQELAISSTFKLHTTFKREHKIIANVAISFFQISKNDRSNLTGTYDLYY